MEGFYLIFLWICFNPYLVELIPEKTLVPRRLTDVPTQSDFIKLLGTCSYFLKLEVN
jgi:hypothetical protein